jgi:hypothetical protein
VPGSSLVCSGSTNIAYRTRVLTPELRGKIITMWSTRTRIMPEMGCF